MPSDDVESEVAAAAHRCWCDHMAAAGWQYGPRYDEAARTHDALRPFAALGRHDRRLTLSAVRAMELARLLAGAVDYPRGPDREFTVEEMRAGLPIAMVPAPGDEGVESDRGVVESWETDAAGDLRLIRVRWADGEVAQHDPAARELRRV
jgi:RyR domain